jgi:hypothetical protein
MKLIQAFFLIAALGCASGQSLPLPAGTRFVFKCDAESLATSVRLGPNDSTCVPQYVSQLIAVTPGETYTFGAKIQTERHGAFVSMLVSSRDSTRSGLRNHFGGRHGTSRPGEWQEIAMHYRAERDERYAHIKFYRDHHAVSNEGSVHLKDVAFRTGLGYTDPSTDKIPYETPTVRINSDGQFQINGAPFFPIAIYASRDRDDYRLYADQGFNTVMRDAWGLGHDWQKSHDAGLYHTLDVTPYIRDADSHATALQECEDLAGVIAEIRAHRFADGEAAWPRFLCYYFDNENEGIDRDWTTLTQFKKAMVGRPLYVLQGNQGIARAYNRVADVTGTYVREKDNYHNPGASGFRLLEDQPGLTTPVSWMQITEWPVNSLTAEDLRLRVYRGVIAGARALGIWRDHWNIGEPDSLKIENRLWWGELPALVGEIQAILPILISPNAPMPVTCSDPSVELLTKLKGDTLFVIAASPEHTTVDLRLPRGRRLLVGLFDGSMSAPDAVELPAGATRVWLVE